MKNPRATLITLRKNKNFRQKDVAKALGITTSYYGMIEQGCRTPNLKLANEIANFFEKKVDEIFFTN